MGLDWRGCSTWLLIWLGALGVMLIAILVALFGGSDEGSFGGLSRGDVQAILGDSDSGSSSGSGSGSSGSSGDAYSGPDTESPVALILVADPSGNLVASFSVQDMIDGDGFEHVTSDLAAEGRERSGVLLAELLAKASVEDWSRLVLLGAFGESIEVDYSSFAAAPGQYLLYWDDAGDPSAGLMITDPGGQGSVTYVTNILILE